MSLLGFGVLLIIAALCGAIGQLLGGGETEGCIISIIVGFLGALIGTWIADQFRLPHIVSLQIEGRNFPVVWSIIGSTILVVLLRVLTRRR